MTDTKACYTTLGLEAGAPSAEIKRAYRNLSLRLHPDASGDPATARRFSLMVKAYKTLIAKPSVREDPEPVCEDIFTLGRMLAASGDPRERARAAGRLGLSGKRSAWVFLRQGLLDDDEAVRCASVRAAAALGLAQGGGEIAAAYARSGSAARKAMLEIAEATEAELFAPVLALASGDEDPALRSMARRLLRAAQAAF